MNSLRTRQDLEFYGVEGYAEPTWVVRDPLTTRCYHLRAEEYFLLTHLNDARSLADLQQQFEARFYPRQLPLKELQALLADWLFKELLQGDPLLTAQWKQAAGYPAARKPAFWKTLLANPLMIRFRGWNPQTFLDRLAPWTGWIFTRSVLYGLLLLYLWAFSVAVVKWPEIQADLLKLPRLHGPSTWLMLLLGISFTKLLHELGHAVTCRHFGGRCPEMGLMLLVGIPCLYCNVTDAWTFRRRRERMLVSAAGILVDLTVASVCLLIWSVSQPGLIAAVCLLLALLGSVNSLLLNGNPLMRYDGYYLCSDWAGQPNLRSRSFQQARQFFWQLFLGNKPASASEPLAAGLVSYGMLAGGYLWLVLGLILLTVYRGLQPWGAENLAVMAGLILVPTQLIQAGKRWSQEGAKEYRERGRPVVRLWTGNLLLFMLIGLIWLLPFPRRIPATGILLAGNSLPVVSQETGILSTSLLPGEFLEHQQLLFELENADLQREWAKLQTAQLAWEAREAAVLKKRTQLSDSTEVLAVVAEQKQALRSQQQRLQTRLQALAPKTRQAGRFIPDPLTRISASDSTAVEFWQDEALLSAESRHGLIPAAEVLGEVASPGSYRVLIYVEDYWADKILPQAKAVVSFPETGGKIHAASLQQLSAAAIRLQETAARESSAQKILKQALLLSPAAEEKSFQSGWVELPSANSAEWSLYQICYVRLETKPASLGTRLLELIRRTWQW